MRARFRRAANALNLLPLSGDSVAKLDKRRLTRNNRIGAKDFLNRCCALVAVLESMLPARAPKIVLQQNQGIADMACDCCWLEPVANDPIGDFEVNEARGSIAQRKVCAARAHSLRFCRGCGTPFV